MSGTRVAEVDDTVQPELQGDQHGQVEELPHEAQVAEGCPRHSGPGPVHLARVPGRRQRLRQLHHCPQHPECRFLKIRVTSSVFLGSGLEPLCLRN